MRTPEQVARAYIERWNAADFAGLSELFADDMIWHIRGHSPQSGEYTRDQIVPLLMTLPRLPTTKPFTLDLLNITANDQRASVEFTTDLPFKDGRVYRNQYHFLLFVENGKIKRGHEYLCTWTAVHNGIGEDIAKLFA
ncbi:MAG: nuclear transport factor 2 family protein [Caulobacterales bacterium]|jgi:ketosteroid isomerase-like protein